MFEENPFNAIPLSDEGGEGVLAVFPRLRSALSSGLGFAQCVLGKIATTPFNQGEEKERKREERKREGALDSWDAFVK